LERKEVERVEDETENPNEEYANDLAVFQEKRNKL
jgi:hypothetical protein